MEGIGSDAELLSLFTKKGKSAVLTSRFQHFWDGSSTFNMHKLTQIIFRNYVNLYLKSTWNQPKK